MYEVRFRDEKGKTKKLLLENAGTISEALEISCGLNFPEESIMGLNLSNVREVFTCQTVTNTPLNWYDVTARSFDEKPVKYHLLFQATNAEDGMKRAMEAMRQGYEMEPVSIKESGISNVIRDEA